MKNKLYIFLSILIIGAGLFLRLYKMENRASFDWDQNRDYQVISQVASGKYTLIGPVAKGEGGFFLGPLYYYLVTPTYLLMNSSPSALPITSIIIDVLAVAAILFLLRESLGDKSALVIGALWSFSWFAIEISRISWNVSLVPLWSILVLWLLTQKQSLSLWKVGFLGIIFGFSWHVHAALIPITLAVIIFTWKIWAIDLKRVGLFIIGYILPLTPLILFDLRHSGLNIHLMTQMFVAGSHATTLYSELLSSVMMRLGKNTQSLLFGISYYSLVLGYFVALVAIIYSVIGKGIYRLSGILITLNVLAVMALKEPGFPEYYFALSYIPTLILFVKTVSQVVRGNNFVLIIITIILVMQNFERYSYDEISFGLSRKMSVARTMRELNSPLDLRIVMAPGREGGIKAFYKLFGGTLDTNSHLKVVVTDQSDGPIIEGGELTTVIGNFGGIRVAKIVVQ